MLQIINKQINSIKACLPPDPPFYFPFVVIWVVKYQLKVFGKFEIFSVNVLMTVLYIFNFFFSIL